MSVNESKISSLKDSVALKIIIIVFLILILLIPTEMIISLISERQGTQLSTVKEVYEKWGNNQTITGPILIIPFKQTIKKIDTTYQIIEKAKLFPKQLNIEGIINPELRYRGIYDVLAYNSLLNFKGSFELDFSDWEVNKEDIYWDEAELELGISDLRGVNRSVTILINDVEHDVSPGVKQIEVIESGFSSKFYLDSTYINTFEFTLDLNGSEMLSFHPVGNETNVKISSTWATPSFDGAFLPDKRVITKDGFTASWKILQLNRNFPQKWTDYAPNLKKSEFGVNLIFPVDKYQQTMRSAKYAIMFVVLTFVIFFFVEILNKLRVHPIQYLMVGFSLLIFYTLLLSISEHLSFLISYVISSVGITVLITAYSKAVFKKWRITLLISFLLIVLYIFLFALLQLEDYSLLIGSIGLFIIMAFIMYASRNVDWYASLKKINPNDKE